MIRTTSNFKHFVDGCVNFNYEQKLRYWEESSALLSYLNIKKRVHEIQMETYFVRSVTFTNDR